MRIPTPRSVLATALAALPALLLLAACDAAGPTPPDGPTPLEPLPSDQQALVVSAFQDVEALFDLGVGADARLAFAACCEQDQGPNPDDPLARLGGDGDKGPAPEPPAWRDWIAQFDGSSRGVGDVRQHRRE